MNSVSVCSTPSRTVPRPVLASLMLVVTTSAWCQVQLTSGHTDVGVAFEEGAWHLHVGRHEDSPPAEYEPDEVALLLPPAAKTAVPAGSAFNFLGQPGTPLYLLPEVENDALLFLGLSTEELPSGVFSNDEVQFTLKTVTGPGHFYLYQVDALGTPTVFMNSADGVSNGDWVTLTAASHRHVNWAFSAPGIYEIAFEASGTLATDAAVTASGPVTYHFKVLGDAPQIRLSRASEHLHLEWNSVPGVLYRVQRRANLATGDWMPVGEMLLGTGAKLSLEVPNEPETGFFRLTVQ